MHAYKHYDMKYKSVRFNDVKGKEKEKKSGYPHTHLLLRPFLNAALKNEWKIIMGTLMNTAQDSFFKKYYIGQAFKYYIHCINMEHHI